MSFFKALHKPGLLFRKRSMFSFLQNMLECFSSSPQPLRKRSEARHCESGMTAAHWVLEPPSAVKHFEPQWAETGHTNPPHALQSAAGFPGPVPRFTGLKLLYSLWGRQGWRGGDVSIFMCRVLLSETEHLILNNWITRLLEIQLHCWGREGLVYFYTGGGGVTFHSSP